MLATIAYNQNRGSLDLALYEVAKSYHRNGDGAEPYVEHDHAVVALTGLRQKHWSQPAAIWDFCDLKGIVERVFRRLGLDPDGLERADTPYMHSGRSAVCSKAGRPLCVFGQLHPNVAGAWELRGDVFIAEFDLEAMLEHVGRRAEFHGLPQFPAVVRDLAFLVDRNVPAGEMEAALRSAAGEWLESLTLFDLYEGDRIPAGKRSLAYSLTFRAPDRTLTDEEVNRLRDRIVEAAATRHNASLRS